MFAKRSTQKAVAQMVYDPRKPKREPPPNPKRYLPNNVHGLRCKATLIDSRSSRDPSVNGLRFTDSAFYVLDEDAYVWKKVMTKQDYTKPEDNRVIRLMLPAGAIVYVTNYKCRASEAVVWTGCNGDTLYSAWDNSFRYEDGLWLQPTWDMDDGFTQCTSGIHFFKHRKDALEF